jgi:hypothetical protein
MLLGKVAEFAENLLELGLTLHRPKPNIDTGGKFPSGVA